MTFPTPLDMNAESPCPYCKVVAANGYQLEAHIKAKHSAYVLGSEGFKVRGVKSVFE